MLNNKMFERIINKFNGLENKLGSKESKMNEFGTKYLFLKCVIFWSLQRYDIQTMRFISKASVVKIFSQYDSPN